jgi:hypothetical protein
MPALHALFETLVSILESTLTRGTTALIDLSADTTRLPLRIHSITALGTRECELDAVDRWRPLDFVD